MTTTSGTLTGDVTYTLDPVANREYLLELTGYPHVVDPIVLLDGAIQDLGYIPTCWLKPDGSTVPHERLRDQFWLLMHTVSDIEPPRMRVYVVAANDQPIDPATSAA